MSRRLEAKNATALVVVLLAGALVGCTDGTTPDCSAADAGCNPDIDGAPFDVSADGEGSAEAAPDAPVDAPKETAPPVDAPAEGSDGAPDAPAG